MKYTELHLHTDYSLLDGLNTATEYMARAKELGMTHLSITDHGVLSGHRPFQRAAREAGIKPILGCEMYISETTRFDRRAIKKRDDNTQAYNHMIVLAQDATGLESLNRLSEIAWTEGFYNKPRIDLDVLKENSEGLIVLSGCLNGLIAKAIENDDEQKARYFTGELKDIFGDRFFMEIQGHNPRKINEGLLKFADMYGVKPVVTSDCHYAREEDLWLEEAMLILSTSPKGAKDIDFSKSQKMDILERFNYLWPDRQMSFEQFDLFLHSADDHLNSAHWPMPGSGTKPWDHGRVEEAIDNTQLVADMIGEYPFHEGLDLLPQPAEGDAHEILTQMAWEGLKERGLDGDEKARERMREELEIIGDKKFDPYFLAEADAVQWGRSEGILFGPGRGSGAGSLVNYALKITDVNPLDHNLLFFRFINPERNDYPDIDTDVEDKRRSEVKDYVKRKYKHVASIATFGTFQGKNSVRDAARVFMVPLGEVNKALKGADWPSNMDFFEQWSATESGREFIKKYPEVIKLSKFLYGRIRTQGMHAGGLVLSKEPISKYAPMQTAKDNSDEAGTRIPLVALDMEEVAAIGLIKYDFLGLKALSIISDTLKSIEQRHGKSIDLLKINMEDRKIYRNLSDGYTKGVFQCEAVPYTNLLIKMGVSNFDELVASNALVRPGAMNSTAGASFIARKKGEEMIQYPHAVMEPFVSDTYGVVIYQEQVMLTMTELAGMKMSDADKVRKIIGKKRDVAEFEEYKEKFISGASEKVPVAIAERLWQDFEAHAGYSFNKSHAVAYSMISYWTAWLKEYYPLEFMAALLKNEGNKDSRLDYLMEAKRMGIRILLPHVNESGIDFEIQTDEKGDFIRFGLSDIKFISGKIGNRLLEHRPFRDYKHLQELSVTKGSGISTRVLGSLNAIGGAAFPDNPRTGNERDNFYEYLSIPAFQSKDLPPKMKAQFRTLDEFSETETFVSMGMVRGIKRGPGWARVEIVDETGSCGVFTSEHTIIETGRIYVFLIANNRVSRYITPEDLADDKGGDFQFFLERESFPDIPDGMYRVVSFNSRTTKAGNKMAEVVLSDNEKNLTSALVFPQMFMRAVSRLKEGMVVDVKLETTRDGGTLFVENIL